MVKSRNRSCRVIKTRVAEGKRDQNWNRNNGAGVVGKSKCLELGESFLKDFSYIVT